MDRFCQGEMLMPFEAYKGLSCNCFIIGSRLFLSFGSLMTFSFKAVPLSAPHGPHLRRFCLGFVESICFVPIQWVWSNWFSAPASWRLHPHCVDWGGKLWSVPHEPNKLWWMDDVLSCLVRKLNAIQTLQMTLNITDLLGILSETLRSTTFKHKRFPAPSDLKGSRDFGHMVRSKANWSMSACRQSHLHQLLEFSSWPPYPLVAPLAWTSPCLDRWVPTFSDGAARNETYCVAAYMLQACHCVALPFLWCYSSEPKCCPNPNHTTMPTANHAVQLSCLPVTPEIVQSLRLFRFKPATIWFCQEGLCCSWGRFNEFEMQIKDSACTAMHYSNAQRCHADYAKMLKTQTHTWNPWESKSNEDSHLWSMRVLLLCFSKGATWCNMVQLLGCPRWSAKTGTPDGPIGA